MPSTDGVLYGRDVKERLTDRWTPPSYYYHLRAGGHVAAITSHMPNTCFVHLDLKNFFNHVSKSRITRTLKPYFGYDEARDIAANSTVKIPSTSTFALPFGFVQSPVLASICLSKSKLGRKLNELHRNENFTVSVYVDDIIISSTDAAALSTETELVCQAADDALFPINMKKKEGPSATITSFNVELAHGAVRISDVRMDKFKESLQAADNMSQVGGILGYVSTLNSAQVAELSAYIPKL